MKRLGCFLVIVFSCFILFSFPLLARSMPIEGSLPDSVNIKDYKYFFTYKLGSNYRVLISTKPFELVGSDENNNLYCKNLEEDNNVIFFNVNEDKGVLEFSRSTSYASVGQSIVFFDKDRASIFSNIKSGFEYDVDLAYPEGFEYDFPPIYAPTVQGILAFVKKTVLVIVTAVLGVFLMIFSINLLIRCMKLFL